MAIEKENKVQSEEKIEMPKSELASLLKRLERLEGGSVIDLDEPTQHFCKVRLYEGKPISKVYNVKVSGNDPVTEDETMECKLDVIGEKGVETVKADYLEMIRDYPTVLGELIKTNEKDVSYSTGKVAVNQVEGYNTISTGVMVPLKVKMVETTFVIRLPSDEALIKELRGKDVELQTVNI